MKEIICPYCKEKHLADVENDMINFDTGEYIVGLNCSKCKKVYTAVFKLKSISTEELIK